MKDGSSLPFHRVCDKISRNRVYVRRCSHARVTALGIVVKTSRPCSANNSVSVRCVPLYQCINGFILCTALSVLPVSYSLCLIGTIRIRESRKMLEAVAHDELRWQILHFGAL
ncbi:hypothetical protein Mapa_013483 [Marchantia paleacea]|nr:hypothetical protein Mapa_013483 [Marchantia paleacea]